MRIAAVLHPTKKTKERTEAEDAGAEDGDLVDADEVTELEDEGAVTSGEEAVTSEPDAGPATADRR